MLHVARPAQCAWAARGATRNTKNSRKNSNRRWWPQTDSSRRPRITSPSCCAKPIGWKNTCGSGSRGRPVRVCRELSEQARVEVEIRMSEGAYVGSIAAVSDFRAALITFLHEVREAVTAHDIELPGHTRLAASKGSPSRWHQEARSAEDAVTAAKIELERCRASKLPGGGTPSCMEEKKLLERARAKPGIRCRQNRRRTKWGATCRERSAGYKSRANQLAMLFDADLPQAIATLDRAFGARIVHRACDRRRAAMRWPARPLLAMSPHCQAHGRRRAGRRSNPAELAESDQPGSAAEEIRHEARDLTTGAAKLHKAWKKLLVALGRRRSQMARLGEHPVRGKISDALGSADHTHLERMRSLAAALAAARERLRSTAADRPKPT